MWTARERSLRYKQSRLSLSKKNGVACLGVTLAWACSSRIDVKYCLTVGCEAGLPIPKSSFHSRPRPRSTNKERNLPIRLSTVPADNVVGHVQRPTCLVPNNLHAGTWILVFPLRSFHTKKRVISWGEVASTDLGVGKEYKNCSSSSWSLVFCFW